MKLLLASALVGLTFNTFAADLKPTYTVVADLESDATYVYNFKDTRFIKNPHSKTDAAATQTEDEKIASAKGCEVAKHVGNAVHIAKWNPPSGAESAKFTTSCKGMDCCK